MASLTMTASFLTSTTISTGNSRRGAMIVKASNSSEGEKPNIVAVKKNDGTSNGRRELVFAAAAAVVYSITNGAMADEPKRGTPEAKKKYGPVCVTMPTARICHN